MQDLINKIFNLNEEQLNQLNEYVDNLLKPKPKKRSLNANSYAWVLMQKIADKLGSTKEEIYIKYIREKGIFKTITISNNAVSTFVRAWSNFGLGWVVEILNKGTLTTDLLAYYGSSSYNTKQMANFIDYIVEEAKLQGIETITPDELAKLKMEWK